MSRFLMPLLLLGFPGPAAFPLESGAAVPPQVVESIRARFRAAKVLSATPCRLGGARAHAYGVLVDVNEPSEKRSHPLRALIVVVNGPESKVTEVARRLEGTKGFVQDFLGEYWNPRTGFTGGFAIRCTSPKADPDIGIEANGEFIGAFASNLGREDMHLCFQADPTYNSWTCSTVNPSSRLVEPSFLQLNAD